jgi:predicted nucleic acid-binding protein
MLLDTCVLAELRTADGSPAVKAFIAPLPAKTLFLTVITIGEIAKGVALLPEGGNSQGSSMTTSRHRQNLSTVSVEEQVLKA